MMISKVQHHQITRVRNDVEGGRGQQLKINKILGEIKIIILTLWPFSDFKPACESVCTLKM